MATLDELQATLDSVLEELRALREALLRQPLRPGRATYSLRAAARALGLDPGRTLHAHIDQGHIRTIPWGSGARIPATEIERVLRDGLPPLRDKPCRPWRRPRRGIPPPGVGARIRAIKVD